MIIEARKIAIDITDEIIASYPEFDAELRAAYLREHIYFDLGDREKQGIARFVELLHTVTELTVHEPKYITEF